MTTTQPTQETVSPPDAQPICFDRPTSAYEYLGLDTNDEHHHYDPIANQIHVTTSPPHEFHPDHTDDPWIRVHGPSRHTEHLGEYDDRGVPEWISYVHSVRGWAEYPTPIRTRRTPTHLTFELEHPVTPGDIERAYCDLQSLVSRTNPTLEGEHR
ncbi:hypothetical protein [Saliphagus infecundisoli]|uniref:Uncharacterized protein n=1 Tax=Saliphagus infecundisoli TaxID=1849069 RepID=A0ABD5QKW5_9EURY|nr:hypothetical protein [Saliphagus infecundisoli]